MTANQMIVMGLGGAGALIVRRFPIDKKHLMLLSTDKEGFEKNKYFSRLLVGPDTLNGTGAGRDVRQGEKAIDESWEIISNAVSSAGTIVIVAGAAGGTGGAGPHLAKKMADEGKSVFLCLVSAFSQESLCIQKIAQKTISKARSIENHLGGLVVFYPEKNTDLFDKCTYMSEYFVFLEKRIIKEILFMVRKNLETCKIIIHPGQEVMHEIFENK